MNMKKIMASVAASALAVSAVAANVSAEDVKTNYLKVENGYYNPTAVSQSVSGVETGDLFAALAADETFYFTAWATVDVEGKGQIQANGSDCLKGANVSLKLTYTVYDATDPTKVVSADKTKTITAVETTKGDLGWTGNEDDPVYEFKIFDDADPATILKGNEFDRDDGLNKVTAIELTIDGGDMCTGVNVVGANSKPTVTYKDGKSVNRTVDAFTALAAKEYKTSEAGTSSKKIVRNGYALVAKEATNFETMETGLTLWTADAINTNKGAQIKFTFFTQEQVDNGITYIPGDDGVSPDWLPVGADTTTLKDFAIGFNRAETSYMQAQGIIEGNTITFNVDEIMSDTVASAGDIHSIWVKSLNNLVLEKVEVIIPDQASVTEPDETDATEDTEASLEGDETTAAEDTSAEDGDNTSDVDGEGAGNTAGTDNPGTGVALAVVPAIVAGAAVVASRKRK